LIPEIRKKAVEVLRTEYPDVETALAGIAALKQYYTDKYPDFIAANSALVDKAVLVVQNIYQTSVFPDQKDNWDAHPNNLAHKDTPGCFRCHDGKHLSVQGDAVRLECNLCHSIPVVSGPSQIVNQIEVSKGFEPDNHKNTNWISIHYSSFDESCAACHTVTDPGGSSNQSFCSNSGCHATQWEFAGFDAPKLREKLGDLIKQLATPTPEPTMIPATNTAGETPTAVSYENGISELFTKCTACHGPTGMKGVDLSSYASIMAGGDQGPLLVAGDPANSQLVIVQSAAQSHFGQFTAQELEMLIAWIQAGAPEK
jgi:mono/diheme cytochrome c family protein